jgi:hypothetical protein
MSCQNKQDFCVGTGETFQPVLRWGSEVLISKPISAISQAAPVVVSAVGHAVPDGWRVAVVSAKGMTQINAKNFPPTGTDWHKATVLTVDTVQLNRVNSADYAAYLSGGFLVYNTPVTLTGMTAKMTIRDAPITGAVLVTLTEILGITLNDTAKTITPLLATAALTWTTGYYDLELTDTGGKVTQLLSGVITIN